MQPPYIQIDSESLEQQREARNFMKGKVKTLMVVFFVPLGLLLILTMITDQAVYILLFFGLLLGFYFYSNYFQWKVLLKYDLKCPHCKKSLARGVNLLVSPNHNCPHCKQRALAGIRQLEDSSN